MELPESTASVQIPCRHLRSKEMYYQGSENDDFASGQYWCDLTHDSCGPDGAACGKMECCAQRTCYVS